MRVVAAVFARGGSKGLPRKNLRMLVGKPLIAHAIDAARQVSSVSRVVVSTEDEEIAAAARAAGAEVPFMRPMELATDTASEWLAWQHLIRMLRNHDQDAIDALLSVPATAPLRSVDDLERTVEALHDTRADAVITVRPAERSPYFNMVTLGEDATARLVITPDAPIERRQAAPAVYDITTVAYAVRADFVLHARSLFEGDVRAVVVPAERALDIDTLLDFRIAEYLIANR
jgi:N-acylneuraminate cytidylyltransferase